jgi:hypothetical protein
MKSFYFLFMLLVSLIAPKFANSAAVGTVQLQMLPNCAAGSIVNYNSTTGVFTCTSIAGQTLTWTAPQTFQQSTTGGIQGYTAKVTTQSGTTYTLASTDCGTRILFTSNSAVTVTLPNSLAVGCEVSMSQYGTSKVSVAAASGATVNSRNSFTGTSGQYASIGVIVDQNSSGTAGVYELVGDGS